MAGYPGGDLREVSATTLVPPDDEPARLAVQAAWAQAGREPGAVGRARVPLLTRDGRQVLSDRVSSSIEMSMANRCCSPW